MGIVLWIIFGALAGWAASILVGSNKSLGLFKNIVVGIVGAAIGGILMYLMGMGGDAITGFNFQSFLVAVMGAVVLLWLVGLFQKGR